MADIKWTRLHENITKIKNVDELVDLDKENNIVILPEDMRMNTAIDTYVNPSGYYVEYIHWNNNGILDGFIDHKKNMLLLNDEYETRKVICDKLFDRYKTQDFKWTNQSYTSMAASIFKQINGYIT